MSTEEEIYNTDKEEPMLIDHNRSESSMEFGPPLPLKQVDPKESGDKKISREQEEAREEAFAILTNALEVGRNENTATFLMGSQQERNPRVKAGVETDLDG